LNCLSWRGIVKTLKGDKQLNKLRIKDGLFSRAGQTAMEYLILLGIMTVIALTAFQTLVPDAVSRTNGHFNVAAANIVGGLPQTSIGGPWP
jgi:Flp pilus assembly pilin Flp